MYKVQLQNMSYIYKWHFQEQTKFIQRIQTNIILYNMHIVFI